MLSTAKLFRDAGASFYRLPDQILLFSLNSNRRPTDGQAIVDLVVRILYGHGYRGKTEQPLSVRYGKPLLSRLFDFREDLSLTALGSFNSRRNDWPKFRFGQVRDQNLRC